MSCGGTGSFIRSLDVIGPVFQPEQASRGNPSPSGDKWLKKKNIDGILIEVISPSPKLNISEAYLWYACSCLKIEHFNDCVVDFNRIAPFILVLRVILINTCIECRDGKISRYF
jgi:hypothetical protein